MTSRTADRHPAFIALLAISLAGLVLAGFVGLGAVRPDLLPPSMLTGGAFALTDQTGQTFTERDLKGRPSLLYFGYTHCPDICTTTLFELSAVMAALGADAGRFNVLFVTVDPARDTPAAMRAYIQAFDPGIRGLTGSSDAIAAMMRLYGARATPVGEPGTYTVDHSTAVLVLDRDGRPRDTLNPGQAPAAVADALRQRWLTGGS